jgi:prephenate dehydrogenase
LLDELDAYTAVLAQLRASIAAADGAALEAVFARSRVARTEWQAQRAALDRPAATGDAAK